MRNEAWILGFSARVALQWCDGLVILNHASTDATPEIVSSLLKEFDGRVWVVQESSQTWDEMQHRQYLLETARAHEATHIGLVDADEVVSANVIGAMRPLIESLPAGDILQIPGYNLRGSINRYHSNGIWGNRWFSIGFKDFSQLNWSGNIFHNREPMGITWGKRQALLQGEGGVLHFWGVSERRLLAKHALYKMTEVLRWPSKYRYDVDRQYSMAVYPAAAPKFAQNWEYATVPETWLDYGGLLKHYHPDAEPWQVAEVTRLLKTEGSARFQGLDLFLDQILGATEPQVASVPGR